jgi:agmatinase
MELLDSLPPYNLFGLEGQSYKKAKVVAIPIPYDSTSTYRAGSREGPHAIIEASRSMELYDEETGLDMGEIGVYTTDELAPDVSSPENMVKRVEREVAIMLDDSKIPLLIGGEHTVSLGAIRALAKRDKGFSVLQFDAHSDTRDELLSSRYCHSCVMARAREVCSSCYGVGIRSVDKESARRYKGSMLYMKDIDSMGPEKAIENILGKTKEGIYLTIDLDVLDTGEMPSVGTPEPGGMSFRELTRILKGVIKEREVIGLDFVELCPIPSMKAPDYLAAKLIYTTLGGMFQV